MAKKVTDDAKVFDVAKPGKGKIVTTSRPVVAPLVAESISDSANAENKPSESMTPSAARKIIQPITVTDNSSEGTKVKTATPQTIQASPDSLTKEMEQVINQTDENATTPDANAEPGTRIAIALGPPKPEPTLKPDITPASKDPEPEPETEPANEDVMSSDSARVDALAKEAEDKSKEKSKPNVEEERKRDEEVQALITSKKYVVPISHGLSSSTKKSYVGLLFLLITLFAVVGAYFVADAAGWKIFGSEKQAASNQPATTTPTEVPETETDETKVRKITDKEITDPVVDGMKQYKDTNGFSFLYPTKWTRYQRFDSEGTESTWIATDDYQEYDTPQLAIKSGGAISIHVADTDINNIMKLAESRKNEEAPSYYVAESVEIVDVGSAKVVRYDSGHTTEGVTYEWLMNKKILVLSYSSGGDENTVVGDYKKQASYPDFIKLIESVSF